MGAGEWIVKDVCFDWTNEVNFVWKCTGDGTTANILTCVELNGVQECP